MTGQSELETANFFSQWRGRFVSACCDECKGNLDFVLSWNHHTVMVRFKYTGLYCCGKEFWVVLTQTSRRTYTSQGDPPSIGINEYSTKRGAGMSWLNNQICQGYLSSVIGTPLSDIDDHLYIKHPIIMVINQLGESIMTGTYTNGQDEGIVQMARIDKICV